MLKLKVKCIVSYQRYLKFIVLINNLTEMYWSRAIPIDWSKKNLPRPLKRPKMPRPLKHP